MLSPQSPKSGVRLAEVVAALSLATDLGMGQPMEFALRTCVLAVRLGELLGLDERELRDTYYVAQYRGCTLRGLCAGFPETTVSRIPAELYNQGNLAHRAAPPALPDVARPRPRGRRAAMMIRVLGLSVDFPQGI